jgi:hypothetical protein
MITRALANSERDSTSNNKTMKTTMEMKGMTMKRKKKKKRTLTMRLRVKTKRCKMSKHSQLLSLLSQLNIPRLLLSPAPPLLDF